MNGHKNTMTLEFTLTKDAEVKATQSGTKFMILSGFPLSESIKDKITGEWKQKGDTIWCSVNSSEERHLEIASSLKKGVVVIASGTANLGSFTDKQGTTKITLKLKPMSLKIHPNYVKKPMSEPKNDDYIPFD